MKIYKLSQELNNDYDTYDSVVVCAENEEDARKIHPSEYVTHHRDEKWYGTLANSTEEYENSNGTYKDWVDFKDIGKIKVEYLGEADKKVKRGVLLGSFNAG